MFERNTDRVVSVGDTRGRLSEGKDLSILEVRVFFITTLDKGPRRPLRLRMSDTQVFEPVLRALSDIQVFEP